MRKDEAKPGAKYRSRKKVDGKWVYDYGEPKKISVKKGKKKIAVKPGAKKAVIKEKPRIENFYGKGRHKYFKTEELKKEFVQRQKTIAAGGKAGYKVRSTGRMKISTKVKMNVDGRDYIGTIVATNGTSTRGPSHYDIEYIDDNGKKMVRKHVPKTSVTRYESSWYNQKLQRQQQMKLENRVIQVRDHDEKVLDKARKLVMSDWDAFSKIAGKYYQRRVRGGWDASKFGFDEADLKQECFLVVYNAALAFLTNKPKKGNKTNFHNYVRSFLKANLAARLAASSGGGGHLSIAGKEQMYLWFFKDTLDDYKQEYKRIPSDVELVEILEKKRKELPDVKGHKVIRDYEWTVEKVRNKKKMSKKMVDLDRNIEVGGGSADTLLSILNDEELDTFGHYKLNPWVEVEKRVVRSEVEKAINRVFRRKENREILKRSYGLFVDENSPPEVRQYAQGQTPGEIADFLNEEERREGSRKRWTPSMVEERELELLNRLRKDEDFRSSLQDFVKSKQEGLPDVALIMYWITMHDIISNAVNEMLPEAEYSLGTLTQQDQIRGAAGEVVEQKIVLRREK